MTTFSTGVRRQGFTRSVAGTLAVFAAAGLTASALGEGAAIGFGREGTVKVRVPREGFNPAQLAPGARVVGEYEQFSVIETPINAVPAGAAVEVLNDENKVLLNTGALDTTAAAVKALRAPRGEFGGRAMHLVQFAGPVKQGWLDQVLLTGVRVVTYIPSNAYLVYGDAKQIAALQQVAGAMPEVQWEGAYREEYKIDPAARAIMNDGARAASVTEQFSIQLVDDAEANAQTLAQIDGVRSAPVREVYRFLGYTNIVVAIPPALLAMVASQPDVVSIQPWGEPRLNDERQDQIVAGNMSGSNPSGPGYLAWLASKGFTQAQFNTSNFAVDVTDSGLDNGTTTPNHFGLRETGNIAGASRVVYARLEGSPNAGSTIQGCDGHGNLNSHIVMGYNNAAAGFPHTDGSGYRYGLGVCPFTKVGSSTIFDPSNYTNPNVTNLQARAYNGSARISTNSWGNTSGNTYTAQAQSYDALVRDAQPAGSVFPVAGNQQMVIVFAAGNNGSGANTVAPPGTAKNVITVGAGENVQAMGGSDQCGWPDSIANSANDIASFSSRGPCSDGRKKPDLVAPGTHVSGGVAQQNAVATGNGDDLACFNAGGVCGGVGSNFFPAGQQFYTTSTGTSHSTPAVAGGCALIRQFFINQGLAAPSPAMTKAILMNSARYMNGVSANDTLWSANQGMGMMNLGEAFNRGPVPSVLRDQDASDLFTASGQTRVFTGSIADTTKPFRVTLAWTDAPGATSGSAAKNNLDLTVTIGANTYRGNVFTGQNSVTGGAADTLNNVESVHLPAGTSGSFTVTVTATNINSDGVPNSGGALDQDFALVVYNGAGGCIAASVSGQPSPQTVCAGSPASFSVTASGTAPYSYQWRKNGGTIAGATASSYSIASAAATDAATYDCVVSNSCGSAPSAGAALTVNTTPSISGQPQPAHGCQGELFAFSVTAGGPLPVSYQWRRNGSPLAGAASDNYSAFISAGTAGSYDCVVTNSCGSTTSSAAVLTMDVAPSISDQPDPQAACLGQPFSFSVTGGGTPAPTYQWRRNGSDIPGATASAYSGTASPANAGNYECLLTNSCGEAVSDPVALTVNSGPSISADPVATAACPGSPFSFSVTAGGTPAPTYQWRKNTVGIPGATSSLYGGTATPGDAGSYDCVVTNSCGSTTSTAATLTVNAGPAINSQPVAQEACVGSPFSFSVSASGSPAPTYQWRKDTVNIPGATANTYSGTASAGDAGSYDCVVSNSCGSSTSNAAALTLGGGPQVDTQPQSQTAANGSSVSFTVASSAATGYQWRKDTVDIGGATSSTYTILPVVSASAGSYDCRVSNSCGETLSNAATLTVTCYANCDDSTQSPILNVSDFTCFLQKYSNGDAYANCDGSTQAPVLNVSDFTCFLQKYSAGCP